MQTTPQLPPTSGWQQALNPKLVQRLWQPAQQPGLVRTRQAQALLARHQRMTMGLPLAALAQRGGALLDAAAGQVPIVYAQPVEMDDAMTMNATTVSQTDVHVHQVMPIVNAMPHSTSGAAVIQRKMAPQPLAPMASAPIGEPPIPNTPSVVQQDVDATRMGVSPAALPVAYAVPVLADGSVVTVSSPVASPVLPAVRNNTQSNESDATRWGQWAGSLPVPVQAPSTNAANALPVVREQPTPERVAAPSSFVRPAHAITSMQLPLIEVPQAQNAATPTNSTERQQPNTARQTSATQPHQPAQPMQHPQPNQTNLLNVDDIVDKVHRKFLRRLTSEAERRGVR